MYQRFLISDMEIENDTILSEQNDTPSLSDLIRDCQYQTNNFHFSQLLDDFASDWTSNTDATSETLNNIKTEHIMEEEEEEEEEEQYEEESSDSVNSVREQPPASLFKVTNRRPWPWQRNSNTGKYFYFLYCMHKIDDPTIYCLILFSRRKSSTYDPSRRGILTSRSE